MLGDTCDYCNENVTSIVNSIKKSYKHCSVFNINIFCQNKTHTFNIEVLRTARKKITQLKEENNNDDDCIDVTPKPTLHDPTLYKTH